jgi:hypothetical protein
MQFNQSINIVENVFFVGISHLSKGDEFIWGSLQISRINLSLFLVAQSSGTF